MHAWPLSKTQTCREYLQGFVVLLCVAMSSVGTAGPVEDYLAPQPMIRVLAVSAPAFGHQITALTWVRRLREMGYAGTIEIVVEEGVREKFGTLNPRLENARTTIVSKTDLQKAVSDGTAKPVDLAIIPAEDYFAPGGYPIKRAVGRPTPRDQLAAKHVLRMQPHGWRDGFRSVERADGQTESLEDLLPLLMQLPRQESPASHDVEVLSAWLQETSPRLSALERQTIATLMSQPDLHRLPFYCAHEEQVPALVQLIKAAANLPGQKPVVIWTASELSDFQWSNVVRGTKTLADNGQLSVVDASIGGDFNPAAKVRVIRLHQPSGQLFEELVRTTTLPPAVTGKYAQNLMMQLGQPWIELKFFEEVQSRLHLDGPALRLARNASAVMLNAGSTAGIVDFFQHANDPIVRRSFAAGTISHSGEDLIYRSLERLVHFTGCEAGLTATTPRP